MPNNANAVQSETREISVAIKGSARPVWAAIAVWCALMAFFVIILLLILARVFTRLDIPGVITMYVVGALHTLVACWLASDTLNKSRVTLYGRALVERLGRDYMSVTLEGKNTTPHSMRLNARKPEGGWCAITALCLAKTGAECRYLLLIEPTV